MKKLYIIFFELLLTINLLANNADNMDDGEYVVTFYTTYSEINPYFPTETDITSHLCLNSDLNSTTCEYGFSYEKFPGEFHCNTLSRVHKVISDTCHIPLAIKYCKVFTSATPNISYNSYITEIHSSNDNKVKQITLYPNYYYLGEEAINGKIKNSVFPDLSQKLFKAKYNVELHPFNITCKASNDKKLLYEDTICIKATKGFPKETYKWRYSYKDAQGKHRKGVFTPYKTEDNGATIYVKGSDFLSESTFYDLVYLDETITITPDGGEGYYKPISFDKINLTPQPYAPKITNVTFKKPLCPNAPARDVTIRLNRPIAQGESIILQFIDSSDTEQRIEIDASICGSDKIKVDSIEAKRWEIKHFKTTYKNIKGEDVSSHSEGEGMHAYIEITSPDPIAINNISQTTTSCIGRSDGTISCEVNGGTGEKICSLNNYDDKSTYNGRFQDGTFVFTGIPKGSYYLEATDENGCLSEKSDTIKISDPEPLKIEIKDITNLRCFGDSDGIISYATSGGTGDIKCYLQNFAHVIKDSTYSNSFSKLSAGTYYLSATDENGCVTNKDTEFEISEPDSLWLELTTTDATIFGNCNGTLSASFGGGTDSCTIKYLGNEDTYSWPQENIELSKYLCAGESEVTLIDGNNCTTTKKYIINQPDPLSAKVIQVDTIKCFGESTASLIVDSIKGGIPPYSVFWYNDNFSSEDFRIQDLPAEEYKVKVTDSMDAELVLSFTIDQPQRLEIFSTDIKPAFCRGDSTGSISLIAEGGTLPYKFFLEDTLSTSGEYASLPAGTYTARVEDKNNCITEGLFTIETLSTLSAKISAESPKCDYLNDGFIDLSVENGLEPYKITWYAEDKVLMEDIFTMTELPAGEYSVIVQDAAGCVEKVDTTLYKPAKLEIELPEKLYLCIDQYYPITLENTRIDSVVWYFKDKEYSKSLKTRLRKEGLYNLDITYDKYCHEYKTIKVDTINKSIKANFLVAEDIPINDDAHLINITSKEDYDYVEWVYPENDAWVYGEDEHSFQLVFLNEGTYQVGMISHKDKCEASLFKTIKTFTPKEGVSIEENSYNITQFSIDKSPNNGTFTSHIELSAKADVILYLYNASTGHIVDTQEVKNNKSYDIPFSVKTLAGEYILLLIVPEWEKSSWIKMVIR